MRWRCWPKSPSRFDLELSKRNGSELVKHDNNPYEVHSLSPGMRVSDAAVTFPGWALFASLLVMLPWPILGIVLCLGLSLFETSSEVIFLFGSVTMIFLLPLGFFVSSEWIFGILVGIVWLAALLLPFGFRRKSIHSKHHVALVLGLQSLFSALQAGLGFLVILGKGI